MLRLEITPDPIRLVRMVNETYGSGPTRGAGSQKLSFTIQTSWMGSWAVGRLALALHLTHHPHKADGVVVFTAGVKIGSLFIVLLRLHATAA